MRIKRNEIDDSESVSQRRMWIRLSLSSLTKIFSFIILFADSSTSMASRIRLQSFINTYSLLI